MEHPASASRGKRDSLACQASRGGLGGPGPRGITARMGCQDCWAHRAPRETQDSLASPDSLVPRELQDPVVSRVESVRRVMEEDLDLLVSLVSRVTRDPEAGRECQDRRGWRDLLAGTVCQGCQA